jgi:hypothetical protein
MSKESNENAGVDIELWNKVIEQNKNQEPCCDRINKCTCNTSSPFMAGPDDVKNLEEFIKYRNSKQSWKRKLRNIYLGYKYRFQDWISNNMPR